VNFSRRRLAILKATNLPDIYDVMRIGRGGSKLRRRVLHRRRGGGMSAANGATGAGREPGINAGNVERVHALRQRSQLFTLFELAQAHGARAIFVVFSLRRHPVITFLLLLVRVDRNEVWQHRNVNAACFFLPLWDLVGDTNTIMSATKDNEMERCDDETC